MHYHLLYQAYFMPCQSSYRNAELLVQHVALLKTRYLVFASKYGFEKEALKNLTWMLANLLTVEVSITTYQFYFILLLHYNISQLPFNYLQEIKF